MSRQSLEDLEPLLPESPTSGSLKKEYSAGVEPRSRGSGCGRIPLVVLLAVSALLNVALIVRPMYHGRCTCEQKLYSKWNRSPTVIELCITVKAAPVQDILEYETRLFLHSSDISPYYGPPSEAVDQAWQDLFSCEFSSPFPWTLGDNLVLSWRFENT